MAVAVVEGSSPGGERGGGTTGKGGVRLGRGDALRHAAELQRRLDRPYPLDLSDAEADALVQVRTEQSAELEELLESLAQETLLRDTAIRSVREKKAQSEEERKQCFKARLAKRFATAAENAAHRHNEIQARADRTHRVWLRHANAGKEAKYAKRVEKIDMCEERDNKRAVRMAAQSEKLAKRQARAEASETQRRVECARRRKEEVDDERELTLTESHQILQMRHRHVCATRTQLHDERQQRRKDRAEAWEDTRQRHAATRFLPPPGRGHGRSCSPAPHPARTQRVEEVDTTSVAADDDVYPPHAVAASTPARHSDAAGGIDHDGAPQERRTPSTTGSAHSRASGSAASGGGGGRRSEKGGGEEVAEGAGAAEMGDSHGGGAGEGDAGAAPKTDADADAGAPDDDANANSKSTPSTFLPEIASPAQSPPQQPARRPSGEGSAGAAADSGAGAQQDAPHATPTLPAATVQSGGSGGGSGREHGERTSNADAETFHLDEDGGDEEEEEEREDGGKPAGSGGAGGVVAVAASTPSAAGGAAASAAGSASHPKRTARDPLKRTAELAYIPSFSVLPYEARVELLWGRESVRQRRRDNHTSRVEQQRAERAAGLSGKLERVGAQANRIRIEEQATRKAQHAALEERSRQLLACRNMQQQQAALLRQQASSDKIARSERRREEKLTERARNQRQLNLAHLGVFVD